MNKPSKPENITAKWQDEFDKQFGGWLPPAGHPFKNQLIYKHIKRFIKKLLKDT